MSLNLLMDTKFESKNRWYFTNCTIEDNKLISTDKVFGISQSLVLPDAVKLYGKCLYNILNSKIINVKIGIQNKRTLHVEQRVPKNNKEQSISVVEQAEQEKVEFHIIFESLQKENEVIIWNPLLVNLDVLEATTTPKWLLDKNIYYTKGYNYSNEYKENEISLNNSDLSVIQQSKGKIGVIYHIPPKTRYKVHLTNDLDGGSYYLIKLDYYEINKYGKVYYLYNNIHSIKTDEEQCYLLFRYSGGDVELILENNEELEYLINIKHILLIKIDNIGLEGDDIPYLPFLKGD